MAKNRVYADRAKQFTPFDALRGLREALSERERIVTERVQLSEDSCELLNRKLSALREGDFVTAVYYARGEYLQRSGTVVKIDVYAKSLSLGTLRIPFRDIYDLFGDMFGE